MKATIGAREGKIVVIDGWCTDNSKPERYRLYFPTGIQVTSFNAEVVGMEADWVGTNAVEIYHMHGRRTRVDLEQGSQTRAVHIEREPVQEPRKCPAHARDQYTWEWRDGRWVKKYMGFREQQAYDAAHEEERQARRDRASEIRTRPH